MIKNPYMKLYVQDFLYDDDVMLMSGEEVGIYCLLLFNMWKQGAQLVYNCKELSRLTRISAKKIENFLEKFAKKFQFFEENGKEFFTQKRLFLEYQKMIEIAEKRISAGRAGGYAKQANVANAIANATPNAMANGVAKQDILHITDSKLHIKEEEERVADAPIASPPECEQPAKPQVRIPYNDIVQLYHERLPMCTKCKDLTETRKRQIAGIWKKYPKYQNVEQWGIFFDYIAESDFLTGRKVRQGHSAKIFNLEWFTKPANFLKIVEGVYHDA